MSEAKEHWIPWPVARLLAASADEDRCSEARRLACAAWELSLRLAAASSDSVDARRWADGPSSDTWRSSLIERRPFDASSLRVVLGDAVQGLDTRDAFVRVLGLDEPDGPRWLAGEPKANPCDQAAGLVDGLVAVWLADAVWPQGWHLVRVEAPAHSERGTLVTDLHSRAPRRRLLAYDEQLRHALPGEVWVRRRGRWTSLDPWVAVGRRRAADLAAHCYQGRHRGAPFYVDALDQERLTGHRLERRYPRLAARLEHRLERTALGGGTPVPRVSTFGPFEAAGHLEQWATHRRLLARGAHDDEWVVIAQRARVVEPDHSQAFAHELEAWRRCAVAGLPSLRGEGTLDGAPWFALSFARGASLASLAGCVDGRRPLVAAVREGLSRRLQSAPHLRDLLAESRSSPSREPEPVGLALLRIALQLTRQVEALRARDLLRGHLDPAQITLTLPELRPSIDDLGLRSATAGPRSELLAPAETVDVRTIARACLSLLDRTYTQSDAGRRTFDALFLLRDAAVADRARQDESLASFAARLQARVEPLPGKSPATSAPSPRRGLAARARRWLGRG